MRHHQQGVLCKAGGMRQEVDSRDEVIVLYDGS